MPVRRGPRPPSEASASPEAPTRPARPAARPRSTSEEIAEVFNEETQTTPEVDEAEITSHADDVGEQMNPRTSESTSGPEREAAAAEAAERGPHPDDMRTNEAEIGSTVPDEIPKGGVFEEESPQLLPDGRSARDVYLGGTPSKYSPVGQEVVTRMQAEGTIRGTGELLPGNPNGLEVQGPDGTWHPIDENIDMAHIRDAVTYWNEEGRFYGPRSPQVREFMTDPNNYRLQPRAPNRSEGARLGETYLPPEPH